MLKIFLLVLIIHMSCELELKSIFSFTPSETRRRESLKKDILSLASKTKRGLIETPEEKAKMKKMFEQLESLAPVKDTLKQKYLSAIWTLEYTTSDSILGRKSNPKVGPILQEINAEKLSAENMETVEYFGLFKIKQKVTAELTIKSNTEVNVQFKVFTIGPISFKAPESFKGGLDITYLEKDFRLSRGDKGNLFVLTKYSDLNQ